MTGPWYVDVHRRRSGNAGMVADNLARRAIEIDDGRDRPGESGRLPDSRLAAAYVSTDSLWLMARAPWKRRKSRRYDEDADPSIDVKFERVREVLSPTGPSSGILSMDVRPVSVRRAGDSALFIFEAEGEAKPLALRIELEDTSKEFYYEGPVESFDAWLDDLPVFVSVSIGTGVVAGAGRIDRGDYIELVGA